MKILWLINIATPEASELLEEPSTPFGGWLVNASKCLSNTSNIDLSIAFPKAGKSQVLRLDGKKIKYYAFFPSYIKNGIGISINNQLEHIIRTCDPDIVHIFGTELPHTLSMINICSRRKIEAVISIQGLVSIYAKHYMAFLPENIQKKYSLRDLIKHDNLKQQQKKLAKRGDNEILSIKKINHVIGRTTWDKACTNQINPSVQYHFCNETLREEFYKHTWSFERCERFSIFVSQASSPIKGLHLIIQAMPLILCKFPDAKLYVAGSDITKHRTIIEIVKKTSYTKYIEKMIKQFKIDNKIIFLDLLNEVQMSNRYLESNVFVCPSSIENSPNSLGEAMLLGVPCVASDVGGISDMICHKTEGYVYQPDAPYMLAYYICEIFRNKEIALKFSFNARRHALKTHDRDSNLNQLLSIYKSIKHNAI